MAQLKVIDRNERVLQKCAAFQLEEAGVLTKDENGERIGFLPFRSFHRVVSAQSPHGEKSRSREGGDTSNSPKPRDGDRNPDQG